MRQRLDEAQTELRDLAGEVFGRYADGPRLETIEGSPEAVDRELWEQLRHTGLLGTTVPEDAGGLGLGLVEAALVLEAARAGVSPVPLAETLAAAWFLARHGGTGQQAQWLPAVVAGSAMLAVCPPPSAIDCRLDGGGAPATLTGRLVGVPWAPVADRLLVMVAESVVLLDPAAGGVTVERGVTTARQPAATLTLDRAAVEPVGTPGTAPELLAAWRTLLAALQAGLAEGAVRRTAAYTSSRVQFGKPLSTFQGVALRAADAWIDARGIQSAARRAAWVLDQDAQDRTAAVVAAWWAAEAGQRVVHAAQHLHGGIGADITYPVHRFFLWGKQIEALLGGASALLAELAEQLSPVS